MKPKAFITPLLLLLFIPVYSQTLKTIEPESIIAGFYDYYTEEEDTLWAKAVKHFFDPNPKSSVIDEEIKKYLDSIESGYGPLTEGPGCSWYCGGGPYKITATDSLKKYGPDNIHDFNLLTAWVPETDKGVIGSKINFFFEPKGPRVTNIIIYNGYHKNHKLWKKNARAKKLKLYINNKPVAILKLSDVMGGQSFKIKPVKSDIAGKDLVITLEVMEVYKGTTYDDLAISEINFDGLDVHCFAEGSGISMADGTQKNIENVQPGDLVMSYNFDKGIMETAEVTALETAFHEELADIVFDNGKITATKDHPLWIEGKGWASLNPEKSNRDYIHEKPVKLLEVNDKVFIPADNVYKTIIAIIPVNKLQETYTLELKKGNNFIVDGIIVKTEEVNTVN